MYSYGDSHNGQTVGWRPLKGFQTRACQRGEFETLLGGAAGPGKTAILIALAAKYASHPSGRAILFRTVYKDTLDIRDKMQVLYPQLGFTWIAGDSRWTSPAGGSVKIAHAKTMDEIQDYLGAEYTAVLWDELSLVPREEVWQMILGRIRSTDPTVDLRARASANPIGPGRSWLKGRFVDVCGKQGQTIYADPETGRTRSYVPGTARDNPLLPDTYWQGLKDLPPSVQSALRDGDWDMPLGLFYPELLTSEHLIEPNPPKFEDWHEHWSSFDWGFGHPAAFCSFTRISNVVYWRDTLYMHRYQDEEMAATVKGEVDPRCRQMCYASPDSFNVRTAHSAAAETVADVFNRYGTKMERAAVGKVARAQVLRRLFAAPEGPLVKDSVRLKILDTLGNRRALGELAALVPAEENPLVPAKRDANEKGQHGDDGADAVSFGLVTPSLEPREPPPLWQVSNIADGKDPIVPPWELKEKKYRMPDEDGKIDRREWEHRRGLDSLDQQFGSDW